MSTATETCEAIDLPYRSFAHLKACGRCRDHWPMIASVLDTMDATAVRTVTITEILERGTL
jgi:hypothetical protein